LLQTRPDLVPQLHRRAGGWFVQNGLAPEAISHYLRAGDFELAADLVTEIAEATLMRSELTTFLTWLEQVPTDLIRERPTLSVFQAWAALVAGRPLDAVEAHLENAERCDDLDRTAPVRALLALYRGQIPRAVELSRWSLDHLAEDNLLLRSIATTVVSLSHLLDSDLASSADALEQSARESHQAGNAMVAVTLLCHVGSLRMRQGRLHQAQDIYEEALSWASDPPGHLLPIAGEALMGLGRLLYEWNDLEAAGRYLLEGIELTRQWSDVGAMGGYISLAHLRQAEGDFAAAFEAIDRARELALQTDVTDLDDILVAAHQAQLWVARGNIDAARDWLEARRLLPSQSRPASPVATSATAGVRVEPPVPSKAEGPAIDAALNELEARISADTLVSQRRRTAEYTTLVRVLLALGHSDKALAVLQPLLSIAQRWGLNERVIRFQILRAVAYRDQGDEVRALEALDRALSLAEPAGYVRPFLNEGRPMAQLLYAAAQRDRASEYVGQLLAALPPEVETEQRRQVDLVEPLTERELDVVRRIAEGLSNQQIADRLFISLSTVKWHTSNIYGKLGVKNRTQAVARARTLGLLP
jgi:LuxR family maltose regulon positive regulatory protein